MIKDIKKTPATIKTKNYVRLQLFQKNLSQTIEAFFFNL